MKEHYDFSQGTRGKFFQPDALFKAPVYLGADVQTRLASYADAKGIELSELVNAMLKKDIEIIESVR